MKQQSSGAPELRRSMTAGQMEMISLGGAIGVGLFMGSTSTIKWTGPSVILAYAFVGLILYIVMRALGEMIYVNPGTGSFADYATEYVHPIAGYLAKWANVFEYIVVGMSEVVAATEYLQYWWPHTKPWAAGLVIIAFLALANLASAKAYGSLEFWFAMIKVITIILMILLGFMVIFFGFGNGGHPTGFSNLWSHGGFFTGGISGFFFSMSIIVGSYEGIELLGISAGEVANPQQAIIKSVKSVLFRILIFYVGAIFVIVTIYPWNHLSAVGSPFVSTFAKVGITAAASLINFVVLTAALSGANSGIYSSSRMLFKLAHEAMRLRFLAACPSTWFRTWRSWGFLGDFTWLHCDIFATVFSKTTTDMFVIVFSSSVLPGMIPWFVILLAELRFRKHNPSLMKDHPFKLPLYPLSNYFAFAMLVVIVVFMFVNPDTRISVIAGTVVLVVAVLAYLIRYRGNLRKEN